MIRGPIVPMSRDGVWRLVRQRPELVERGLTVVAENIELGTGRAGHADGLLRDAIGRAVLVFATDDRDDAIAVRVLAAHSFWRRNATGIVRALPEADLSASGVCRLIVVGAALADEVVALIERLAIDGLELHEVESFSIAGQERLMSRQRLGQLRGGNPCALDAAIAASARGHIDAFVGMLQNLDQRVRIEGDRYSRRAVLAGKSLGECWVENEVAHAAPSAGAARALASGSDVRAVVDAIVRQYLGGSGRSPQAAGPDTETADSAGRAARGGEPTSSARSALDSLRTSVSTSRLSREECAALGEGQDPGERPEDGLAEA